MEPETDDSPVLVEVPHGGLMLDAESANWVSAPMRSIARDADLYVDELFADAPQFGATLLCSHVSRYVVDLNRAIDDFDGAAVAGGPSRERPRGVVWRLTSDGLPVLSQRLSREEYRRRCDLYYRPYHDALQRVLLRKRARFGFAVLLCAHSMPTPRGRGQLADLVPGTRGRTSAAASWIDLIDALGREQGWSVQHDLPYRGGYSTGHYGRPHESVHAVQIELARRLYMNERSLARESDGFEVVKAFANRLVRNLVDEALARAVAQAGE
jgi:N-formylglutamate amidohydrolase